MINGVRCQSFIFDGFSNACEVAEVLNVRYPNILLTAVTGRLLSVGVIDPDLDESNIEVIVRAIVEEWLPYPPSR